MSALNERGGEKGIAAEQNRFSTPHTADFDGGGSTRMTELFIVVILHCHFAHHQLELRGSGSFLENLPDSALAHFGEYRSVTVHIVMALSELYIGLGKVPIGIYRIASTGALQPYNAVGRATCAIL